VLESDIPLQRVRPTVLKLKQSELNPMQSIGKCWSIGDHLLLRDFGPYGVIFVCCYNHCHDNVVRDFGPYGVIFVCCYNHCHDNAVRDFGPYGVIFMTTCVHYFRFSRHC
jgi:hypothetical protein